MCKYCLVFILAFPLLNVNTFACFHVVKSNQVKSNLFAEKEKKTAGHKGR